MNCPGRKPSEKPSDLTPKRKHCTGGPRGCSHHPVLRPSGHQCVPSRERQDPAQKRTRSASTAAPSTDLPSPRLCPRLDLERLPIETLPGEKTGPSHAGPGRNRRFLHKTEQGSLPGPQAPLPQLLGAALSAGKQPQTMRMNAEGCVRKNRFPVWPCPWHQRILGQGRTRHHTNDRSHSSDRAPSLAARPPASSLKIICKNRSQPNSCSRHSIFLPEQMFMQKNASAHLTGLSSRASHREHVAEASSPRIRTRLVRHQLHGH